MTSYLAPFLSHRLVPRVTARLPEPIRTAQSCGCSYLQYPKNQRASLSLHQARGVLDRFLSSFSTALSSSLPYHQSTHQGNRLVEIDPNPSVPAVSRQQSTTTHHGRRRGPQRRRHSPSWSQDFRRPGHQLDPRPTWRSTLDVRKEQIGARPCLRTATSSDEVSGLNTHHPNTYTD